MVEHVEQENKRIEEQNRKMKKIEFDPLQKKCEKVKHGITMLVKQGVDEKNT